MWQVLIQILFLHLSEQVVVTFGITDPSIVKVAPTLITEITKRPDVTKGQTRVIVVVIDDKNQPKVGIRFDCAQP